VQSDHVQAIEQIFAKQSAPHMIFDVAVRRRNRSYVGATGFVLSQPLEFFGFQEAKQFRLHRRRDIADLVEKERTAFGGFDSPRLIANGAGKRAAAMAEKFTGQKLLR
jgi:hypothetical protein